ncbi:MAG: terminase, partial [Planctomycetes bacterium]|nr:terminase [Planctomycetota bacterium]
EILGTESGLNRNSGWRLGDKIIDIGGCQLEGDKQKRKGIPHDLKAFDEIADFTETQFTFICAWNRSADPKQRCRVVCTGNPPTDPEGFWVIMRWAAWLDPTHSNPAKDGELRWYTTDPGTGREVEVDGAGPHEFGGEQIIARSRTFIRSTLEDNPDLIQTNYDSVLAALPERERLAYRDGRFDVAMQDRLGQTIPTDWVRLAQARWTEDPPEGVPMCA